MAGPYYVDSQLGSNANSGLSWALAKQSLQGAAAVVATGETIIMRAGSMFKPLAGEQRVPWASGFISFNDLTIRTEARFASDNDLLYQNLWEGAYWGLVNEAPTATGWTHVGNGTTIPIGTWSKVLCSNGQNGTSTSVKVERVWMGSYFKGDGTRRDQLVVGTAYEYARSLGELCLQWPWYATEGLDADMALYVFTGSTTIAPPQFWGGISAINPNNSPTASGTGGGANRSFACRNFTGTITMTRIASYGASAGDFGIMNPSATTSGRLILDRVVGLMCAGSTIQVQCNAGFPMTGSLIAYAPKSYNMGAAQEYTYPSPSHRQRYEFLTFSDYAANCIVFGGYSDDPGHGYASITASPWAARPMNCHVIGGTATYSPWLSDGHPFSLQYAENCSVRGLRAIGSASSAHIGGVNNEVAGCYFKPRFNVLEPAESKVCIDIRNQTNLCPAMSGSRVRNNTIDMSDISPVYGLAAVGFIGAAGGIEQIHANAVAVYNNHFILPSGIAGVLWYQTSTCTTSHTQQVFNNTSDSADNLLGELVSVLNPSTTIPIPRTQTTYNDTGVFTGAANNLRVTHSAMSYGPYGQPSSQSPIKGLGFYGTSATGFTNLPQASLDGYGVLRRIPPTPGWLEVAGG